MTVTGRERQANAPTRRRLGHILAVIAVVALLLFARLIMLQIFQADSLAQTASAFRSRSYTQEALRGRILDSEGGVLAGSGAKYNVRADQKAVSEYVKYGSDGKIKSAGAVAVAEELAPILGMDRAELGGILISGKRKNQWLLLAKGLSTEKWREIEKKKIRGIFPERYMERIYPNGTVAGSVLGFVGKTEQGDTLAGRAGVEQSMNSVLTGKNGKLTVEVGPDGTVFPQAKRSETPAVNGRDIKLTINRDLQKLSENLLHDTVERYGADWASAVVAEVGTGRILALADSGTYNPADVAKNMPKSFTSPAVGSIIEPGSVGKVVTFSTAVDQNKAKPLDTFTVPYQITMPNGEVFHDDEQHPTQRMTMAGIVAKSLNTGTVQIGDRVPAETRYEYLRRFGFGARTGVEIGGEEPGILRPVKSWDRRARYTTMFGQSYAVTPIQLASMIATVAGGGVKYPLHLIDGVYGAQGNFEPKVTGRPQRVLRKETAKTIMELLQGVTKKGGTAPGAAIDGYNVAGKTGTAQILGRGGTLTGTVGSFVGAVPAENPKIAVAVSVRKSGGVAYGGMVAAPVFSEIGKFAMRMLKVPPSSVPPADLPWTR